MPIDNPRTRDLVTAIERLEAEDMSAAPCGDQDARADQLEVMTRELATLPGRRPLRYVQAGQIIGGADGPWYEVLENRRATREERSHVAGAQPGDRMLTVCYRDGGQARRMVPDQPVEVFESWAGGRMRLGTLGEVS